MRAISPTTTLPLSTLYARKYQLNLSILCGMNSTTRNRVTIESLCQMAAEAFGAIGERRPSHCDVRCAINDLMAGYERDGDIVPHRYSQDKAHKRVCAILASGHEERV